MFASALLLAALPPQLYPANAAALLKLHNHERALVGTKPLVWDNDLAQHAQAWAQQLAVTGKLAVSPDHQIWGEGETAAADSNAIATEVQLARHWIDVEKPWFVNKPFPGSVSAPGKPHGNYTQMIWWSTTKVGCGLAKREPTPDNPYRQFLVCRYWPAGNAIGQYPYPPNPNARPAGKLQLPQPRRRVTP